ncbi:MAG: hypothetical protein LBH76_04545, partial [Propionibacteriaceae bacterium]|nr:hypothetical protein [Propionibacteriaceae bacterium]
MTKPVQAAAQRPTPRWVGWLLISLPTLALFSPWLAGRLPLLSLATGLLTGVAAWDWHRFRDRSRSLRVGYIGFAMLISGVVAWAVWQAPAAANWAQFGYVAGGCAVALSVIQLYRGSETVLTLARGWMYLIGFLAVVIACQRLIGSPVPLAGPLPTPQHLATATVIGLVLMPLGYALEHDRRLRWTYPVAAAAAGFVIWSTHQALAVAVAVAVVAVWAATYRRGRWIVVGAAVAAVLVAFSSLRRYFPLAWHDAGMTAGPTMARRRQLVDAGMALLRETWFLGGGPGSYARGAGSALAVAADASGLGPPPWSPYFPLVEIASQYGLAAAVLVVMTGLGLLVWCVVRLVHTSGRAWSSPER